ncbi:NYN domain-containing protein [Natranaerofaba carboxydovora]|uniref:NYN domain-containing protein n=1 Tax=Natranaerofaba carboxydovora TaxID=2742683 RepID=UPI001F1436D3|nr:NYN domain-containing protein [Natranaerofaba carboxydovora]
MALDIARSAFEQRVTHIALISSDSDFVPAIQMAKDKGIISFLLYSEEIKPHNDLIEACDEVIYITPNNLQEMELKS